MNAFFAQVSLEFIGNAAGLKGAAIYANTITPCIWSENPPHYNFKEALRWKPFFYKGNYLTDKTKNNSSFSSEVDIATDTTNFDLILPNGTVSFGHVHYY